MAKAKTYNELMRMAKKYGVEKNALFVQAAKQYELQQHVLDMIRSELAAEGETTTTKEYVKGRENVCVHPLVAQLPKHVDSANKTLATMLNIIQALGQEKPAGDKLGEFLSNE